MRLLYFIHISFIYTIGLFLFELFLNVCTTNRNQSIILPFRSRCLICLIYPSDTEYLVFGCVNFLSSRSCVHRFFINPDFLCSFILLSSLHFYSFLSITYFIKLNWHVNIIVLEQQLNRAYHCMHITLVWNLHFFYLCNRSCSVLAPKIYNLLLKTFSMNLKCWEIQSMF